MKERKVDREIACERKREIVREKERRRMKERKRNFVC
jgi:hypothetical protein